MGYIINQKLNDKASEYWRQAQNQLNQITHKSNFCMKTMTKSTSDLLQESKNRISRAEMLCSPLIENIESSVLPHTQIDKRSKSQIHL